MGHSATVEVPQKWPDCDVCWSFRTIYPASHISLPGAWNHRGRQICSRGSQAEPTSSRCGYWGWFFHFYFWNFEITLLLSSSYLGLSINSQICILMNWRKCSKLVVVLVFHNLPSGERSDGLDSQWRKWADLCFIFSTTLMSRSSPALQLSDLQKSVSTILQGLARTLRSNLSLLTSPLSIAELRTEVVRGLFVEPKLSGRLFSCVDDGMSVVLNSKHWYADSISI